MIKDYLANNNLIICPNKLKKKLIKELNSLSLISYKIMDIHEFLNNYFFSYDKKTIHYVMNKLKVNYSIAKEYLDTLYFLEDKNYNFDKLNTLVSLKKELEEKNLLSFNPNFLYYLSLVKIIIYDIDLDPFYLNILKNYSYEIINIENSKKNLDILEFNSIEDEVSFICNDILEKIRSGIDINNIKIVASGNEYDLVLNRVFNWYSLPLDKQNKISLYDISIGKKIIEMLCDKKSFEEILNELKDKLSIELFNMIISIFNEYVLFTDNEDLIEMITYDLKNTYLKQNHISNAIKIVSFEELEDNNYAYVIGFNKESYPVIHKDEEILSDNMKKELGLLSSNEKNILEKRRLKNNLYKDVKYIITYKLKDAFDNYEPSILIQEENMKISKDIKVTYDKSNFFNMISLSRLYDKYNKYGVLEEDLKVLRPSYKELKYNTYDNKFKSINRDKYLNDLKQLNLSYTSINTYFKCSFRYYLERVLKIKDENIDEFYMNIGNIFHYVLSKYRESDFDFEKLWNEEASKYEFKLSQIFLLEKLKQELLFDLNIIRKQESYSNMHEYLFEKKFIVPIETKENIKVNFTGTADKIIYENKNGRTIASIIDYKTGKTEIDLNNILYGLGMQLPIYMFLLKRSNLFDNVDIAGIYLQIIINKEIKATFKDSSEKLKIDALKLQGYSNSNIDITSVFDTTYEQSEFVKTLKTKKDGTFDGRSRVLSEEELEKIDKIVLDNINKATNEILNAHFDINPKKIGKDIVGCEYCPYVDICFKTQADIKELKEYEKLSFLKGGE